jgi:hypothetical protein
MKDMLEFKGQVVYRAYTFDTNTTRTEYTIKQERGI